LLNGQSETAEGDAGTPTGGMDGLFSRVPPVVVAGDMDESDVS
jgi:hypothetical protein